MLMEHLHEPLDNQALALTANVLVAPRTTDRHTTSIYTNELQLRKC